ncbi:MAG: hypothetical protein KI790_10100 [Cyclobacteriaceae bacterium]|nr:hypothetical protein [Cyclobacteriaceae bacterium HetDA_MAG_MS6]
MSNVIITLTVDLSKLSQGILAASSFSDSVGDPSTSNPEDYSTHVKAGDSVTWNGALTNGTSSDSIAITSIVYEGDQNIFGQNTLNGSGGTVVGTVESGTGGEDEVYTINFTITQNGTPTTYSIDPIVIVDSGG